eukprot:GGOE01014086.1.p1 GENE.GGOE01014086.1~~GGOE01014086.1.p1  ORF type:complete len:274 (+),score=71.23 GGOE01014086.1:60-824(+)
MAEDQPPRKKLKKTKQTQTAAPPSPAAVVPASPPVVMVILEQAGLGLAVVGKRANTLLCHQEHGYWLKLQGKPPSRFRPDVVHQTLLSVFDSPLAKSGRVRVFINTDRNRCIEINPQTRVPRTMKRFQGLMAQLLGRGRGAVTSPEGLVLFGLASHPMRAYVPEGSRVYSLTNFDRYLNPRAFVKELAEAPCTHSNLFTDPVQAVVVVNAASDALDAPQVDYVTDYVTLSQYPMTPSIACSKVLDAFEGLWGIC